MHPILLKLGPITVYSYGVILVVAFLASTGLARSAARRLPPEWVAITADQLLDFASLSLLGGIVGGRVFYILLQWDLFVHAPLEMLAIWHGGLVWYGGLFGGLSAGWLYVRARRLDFLRVMDQFIPFVALGHAIGRLGCFLNGCCYGKPSEAWCAVQFPGHAAPVLPTQLFEAGALLLLFLWLRRLQQPDVLRDPGRLFGAYLAAYAVLRFCLEFLRGDQAMAWAGLTLQQLISLAIFAIGVGLVRPFRRFGPFRLFRHFRLVPSVPSVRPTDGPNRRN